MSEFEEGYETVWVFINGCLLPRCIPIDYEEIARKKGLRVTKK